MRPSWRCPSQPFCWSLLIYLLHVISGLCDICGQQLTDPGVEVSVPLRCTEETPTFKQNELRQWLWLIPPPPLTDTVQSSRLSHWSYFPPRWSARRIWRDFGQVVNRYSRSEAMVITDSVVAWYSSSSINSSWDHASPWKSWWSRSCCRGGALGSSWLTTSRLILGACFRRSLLRICDLIVSNLSTLLCSLQTQAEHSWEPASSSSRDNPESVGVSLAEGSSRLGSSLPDWPRETSTVKHSKKLYFGIMKRKHQRMQLFFLSPFLSLYRLSALYSSDARRSLLYPTNVRNQRI